MRRTFACLLLLCSNFVSAEEWKLCFSPPLDQSFNCLLNYELAYPSDRQYLEALSSTAINSGNYSHASIALERLIAHYPNHAGARLDLAYISLKIDRPDVTETQLSYLEKLPYYPPGVSEHLNNLYKLLERKREADAGRWGLSYTVGAGFDSNANLGLDADSITLLLNGTEQTLIPADEVTPASSPFLTTSLSSYRVVNSRTIARAQLHRNHYNQEKQQSDTLLGVELIHKRDQGDLISLSLRHLNLDNGSHLNSLKSTLKKPSSFKYLDNLELSMELTNSSEDAIGPVNLGVTLYHKNQVFDMELMKYVSFSYQYQPDAPWGDTYSLSAGASTGRPIAKWNTFVASQINISNDASPYSPLFGDLKRNTRRLSLKAAAQYPLSNNSSLRFSLEGNLQSSDIPLYKYDRIRGMVEFIYQLD